MQIKIQKYGGPVFSKDSGLYKKQLIQQHFDVSTISYVTINLINTLGLFSLTKDLGLIPTAAMNIKTFHLNDNI